MVLESNRNGNSIYDEMKSRLYEICLNERQMAYTAYSSDSDLAEVLRVIENDFTFNLFKLDEIAYLSRQTEEIQEKFINQKLYIDCMQISSKNKVEIILTTACILTKIDEQVKNLTQEELFLLGHVMVNVPLKDYVRYGKVLSDVDILERINIIAKGHDSLEIIPSTFECCADCKKCELAEPIYQNTIGVLLPVINKQQEKSNM